MSDVSGGSGWWLASDHKWYPPHLHPSAQANQSEPISQQTPDPTDSSSQGVDESPRSGKRGRLSKRSILWSLAVLAVVAVTLPLTTNLSSANAIISESIAQKAFKTTWTGFAEAFATGNRQSLEKYADQGVQQAVAGWYQCGCGPWPSAYNAVALTAPPQAAYPVSFMAEIHERDYDLTPLGIDAIFTKGSAHAPWLVSYLVNFVPGTGSIPNLNGTSIGETPPQIPFDVTIVGGQFASFFTTVFDTCNIPAKSWPQTGSMAEETNKILDDCQDLSLLGLKESLTYRATVHSPAFALPGGDFMCGEIRWNSVITTSTGKPVVQPADQSTFGAQLAPGSYMSVTNHGVKDACWFADTMGAAHPVSFFGGVYSRVGNSV